jgi:hypothetical protein
LCLLAIFSGVAGICGWLLDVPVLVQPVPGAAYMAFVTAVNVVLAGLGVLVVTQTKWGDRRYPLCASLAVMVAVNLAPVVRAIIDGGSVPGRTDISSLEMAGGLPSVATALCFGLLTLSLVMMDHAKVGRWCGCIVASVGTVAMLGYALSYPPMYYYREGWSNGMAPNTALAFVLLGVALEWHYRKEAEEVAV